MADRSYLSTLRELSMDRLLFVKKSLRVIDDIDGTCVDRSNTTTTNSTVAGNSTPEALALSNSKMDDDVRRQGYHHIHGHAYEDFNQKHEVYYHKKGGKSKDLSTVFQLTVTTLAFLAFGGYLLCLVIQAFKAKQRMNMMMMTTTTVASIRRRPGTRRRPRPRPNRPWPNQMRPPPKPPKRAPRPGGRPRPKRETETAASIDIDRLYYALTQLSEGYVTYHNKHHTEL